MDRTPSPPRRVRTPPAPLHGSKYDSYEPFSPRRSSRVAAQHNSHLHPHLHPVPAPAQAISPIRKRTTRDVTPTSSRSKPIARTTHFALSPPSSPTSPAKMPSPRSSRRAQLDTAAPDSDSDSFAPSSARRLFPSMAPQGMLPTPAKTPRKRALHTADSLGRTARVLFENRPATVEDAMPTPRKARSGKSALSLEGFAEQVDSASKIGVYVDSKERVPDREDEEVNPFIMRRGKGKAKAVTKRPRKMDEKTEKMFQAAARDEGIIYTHRGKRIFRPFEDVTHSDDADGRSSGDDIHRKADRNGTRRITRSAIRPKLLFKEEIQRLKQEKGEEDEEEDDEEAPTDIEIPVATPSRRARHIDVAASFPQDSVPVVKVKRQTSFESWSGSWRRVKSSSQSSSSPRGTKRGAEALEGRAEKRVKGGRGAAVEEEEVASV